MFSHKWNICRTSPKAQGASQKIAEKTTNRRGSVVKHSSEKNRAATMVTFTRPDLSMFHHKRDVREAPLLPEEPLAAKGYEGKGGSLSLVVSHPYARE